MIATTRQKLEHYQGVFNDAARRFPIGMNLYYVFVRTGEDIRHLNGPPDLMSKANGWKWQFPIKFHGERDGHDCFWLTGPAEYSEAYALFDELSMVMEGYFHDLPTKATSWPEHLFQAIDDHGVAQAQFLSRMRTWVEGQNGEVQGHGSTVPYLYRMLFPQNPFMASAAEIGRMLIVETDAKPKMTVENVNNEAQAIALCYEHPDWKVADIADKLQVTPKAPYKWKKFMTHWGIQHRPERAANQIVKMKGGGFDVVADADD